MSSSEQCVCQSCHTINAINRDTCYKCGHALSETAVLAQETRVDVGSAVANPFVRRYRDAYVVANTVVGVGSLIKGAGVVFGFIIGLISLSADGALKLAGLTIAVVVAGIFIIAGILIAAVGQMNQAALDVAVYGSPFLTQREMAAAMRVAIASFHGAEAKVGTAPTSV